MEVETIGKLAFAKKSLDVTIALVDSARWNKNVIVQGKDGEKILEIKGMLLDVKRKLSVFIDE